jgi:hypothetical protein
MKIDKETTAVRINSVASQVQRWIDFNKKKRDDEDFKILPETFTISPSV